MGFPFDLALRYMRSKKQASISLGTFFAIAGVALGVAGLATAMSVTGGFRKQFQDKVLGVNAHVLILKRSSYFGEYRDVIDQMKDLPEVTGIAPFTINPMMVTKGDRTVTGVLLKGVDPERIGDVLDLPRHIVEGSFEGLRLPDAEPPAPREVRSRVPKEESKSVLGALDQALKKETQDATLGVDLLDLGADGFERALEAAAKKAAVEPVAESSKLAALPSDAPLGSIVPEGGYTSALPDDDHLPSEVDPDPCQIKGALLPGIVIGRTLGQNLKAALGDCIQVTSPTIGFSFSGEAIRAPVAKRFRVIAIFDAGFDQYDAKLVYTDLYEAQSFQDNGDSVTGIEMRVRDVDQAGAVAKQIGQRLEGSSLYTMDWEELNHGLFTALQIQQIVMSSVLGIIIIVAAFTVIATLIMVVLDKKKEIAVLKAMGASNSAVLRAFLYQGGLIGVVGGVLGITLAIGVCEVLIKYALPLDPKVYFISSLPVDVQPLQLGLVFVFAVLVCLGATVWPALHAAHLRPAEAFREQ